MLSWLDRQQLHSCSNKRQLLPNISTISAITHKYVFLYDWQSALGLGLMTTIFGVYYAGMWPRSRRLGLEAVSMRSNASARSRLGVGTPRPRLGLEL